MPEATTQATTPNPPTQDAPAPTPAVQPNGNAAAPAEDFAKIKADMDRLLAHKAELEKDLAKYRARNDEEIKKAQADKAAAEAKLKEQGDHLKLYELEKDKRTALEAQIAALSPKATQWEAIEKTMGEKVAAASADPNLPAYIKKAIANASNVYAASEVLDEFRAAQATAPKGNTPAPPAPQQGAAPAAQPITKRLEDMTPAEILNLKPNDEAFKALRGGGSGNTSVLGRFLGS